MAHHPADTVKYNGLPEPSGKATLVEYTTVDMTREPPPRDHFIWSLFNFFYANICCLGLAAVICSIKARDRKMAGDVEGARHHGCTAFGLNTANTVLLCILIIIIICLYVYGNPMVAGVMTSVLVRRL